METQVTAKDSRLSGRLPIRRVKVVLPSIVIQIGVEFIIGW